MEDIGKPTDIAKLDDSLDEERTMLMNLLDDAESLKLIEISNGDVSIIIIGPSLKMCCRGTMFYFLLFPSSGSSENCFMV